MVSYSLPLMKRAFSGRCTRGDGLSGEDITSNIKNLAILFLDVRTKTPPAVLEVRGEIICRKKVKPLMR